MLHSILHDQKIAYVEDPKLRMKILNGSLSDRGLKVFEDEGIPSSDVLVCLGKDQPFMRRSIHKVMKRR